MSIFKAYDVRGIYPTELQDNTARDLGRAFAQFLGKGPIAVGRDMRASGAALSIELIRGIREAGCNVVYIGECTSPMLTFTVANYGYAGGVMITASHNPAQYNGFKLCREFGIPISGDTGLKELEIAVTQNISVQSTGFGYFISQGVYPDYRDFLVNKCEFGPRKLKVVVDFGNGMGGAYYYGLLQDLRLFDVIGMYTNPDGSFPNHEANPLVEKNLDDLRVRVLAENADLGIAFDGDADRAGFVDETGKTVFGDFILSLLARTFLKKSPEAKVLYDLRSSRATKEEIEALAGIPLESRVGHSFIKKTMREHDAVLGGELSGHFYFRDLWYLDSGIYAVLKMLELLSCSSEKFSELVFPLDRYPRTGELNFAVEDAASKMAQIESQVSDAKETGHLDGLSVVYEDWWFNLRMSNTEPLLRLNLQAKTVDRLAEKYRFMLWLIGSEPH